MWRRCNAGGRVYRLGFMRLSVRPISVLIAISLCAAACGSSSTPRSADPVSSTAAGAPTSLITTSLAGTIQTTTNWSPSVCGGTCGSPAGKPPGSQQTSSGAPGSSSPPSTTSQAPSVQTSAEAPTGAAIKADAQAAVDQVAGSFPRPPSARPARPDQRLVEGFMTPPGNVVYKSTYLTSTGTVQQTLAFYTSALAHDGTPSSAGDFTNGSIDVKIIEIRLPGGRREYSAPQAQIGVAAVAGGVAIAVRISSSWNPQRPVNTYIGPSPGTVDVIQGRTATAATFHATITGAGATRLAAVIDALGTQVDASYNCPTAPPKQTTTMTFHPPGQEITVTLPDGCPYGPFLDVGGASYTLTSDGTIRSTLQSVLPSLPTP